MVSAFADNHSTLQKFVWIDTRGSDGLGHRFEMAVEHDAVVADQVAGHSGWIIQNQKVDTFQSHTIGQRIILWLKSGYRKPVNE